MAIRLPVYEQHVQLDSGAHTIARIHADDATGKAISRIGESMISVAAHWKAKEEQRDKYNYMDQLTVLNTELARIKYEVGQEYQPGIHPPNWYHEQVTLRSKPLIENWVRNAPASQQERAVSHGKTIGVQTDLESATVNSQIDKTFYTGKLKQTVAGFAKSLADNPDAFEDAVKQYDETLKSTASLTGYEKETIRRADLNTLHKAALAGLVKAGRVDEANVLNETFTKRMDKEDRTQRGAPAVGGGGGAGGGLNKDAYEKTFKGTALEGKYDKVVEVANKNGVPPAVVAGIMAHETGGGRSKMVAERNNPAGLMDPSTGSKTGLSFASIDEGLERAGETIGKHYQKAGGSIPAMNATYAPPGAANDPQGQNQGWAAGVSRYVQQFSQGTQTAATGEVRDATTFTGGKPMQKVEGMVIHHTGGRGDVNTVIDTLKQRGLSVQFVIDRDGTIHRLVPEGQSASHMKSGWGERGQGKSNANMQGVEIIANNDKDVTPQQVAAAQKLIAMQSQKYGYDPKTSVFGHGQVNPGHKESDEGMKVVSAVRGGQAGVFTEEETGTRRIQTAAAKPSTVTDATGVEEKPKIIKDPDTGQLRQETTDEMSARVAAPRPDGSTASNAPAPRTATAPPVNPAPAPKSFWQSERDANSILIDAKQLKISATDKAMKATLKEVIKGDIANVEKYGVGSQMPPELQKYFHAPSGELSHELIANKLGEAAAIQWEEDKLTAGKFHGIIADMDKMSRDNMIDRLDAAKPVPGSWDIVRQEASWKRAQTYAQKMLEERNKDPAEAARAFPAVEEARDALKKAREAQAQEPTLEGQRKVDEAQANLARLSLRAQTLLGVKPWEQSPIENQDAERIASMLLDRTSPNSTKAADAVVREVKKISGGDPQIEAQAFRHILDTTGLKKDDQEAVANRLSRANRTADTPDQLQADEAQRRAIKQSVKSKAQIEDENAGLVAGGVGYDQSLGEVAPREPENPEYYVPGTKQLDSQHITELMRDPSTSGIFDRLYGKGASQYVLGEAQSKGFPIGPRSDYADNPEVMPYAGTGEGPLLGEDQKDPYDPDKINPLDIQDISTPEL